MSYFLPELSLLNYRVVLIAPTVKEALEICEQLAFELTTELSSPGQKLDLINYSPTRVPVNSFVSWTSATLGTRGPSRVRIHLISFGLENGLVSENIFELADALILYNPTSNKFSERFLKLSISSEHQGKPVLLINSEADDPEKSFRGRALGLWAERKFSQLLSLKDNERLFERILDWAVLSQA